MQLAPFICEGVCVNHFRIQLHNLPTLEKQLNFVKENYKALHLISKAAYEQKRALLLLFFGSQPMV